MELIANICQACHGNGMIPTLHSHEGFRKCNKCKGEGVIARKQKPFDWLEDRLQRIKGLANKRKGGKIKARKKPPASGVDHVKPTARDKARRILGSLSGADQHDRPR